ncbi:shikimate kinase [Litorimonas sp. RW-G-Af-16]|uniref:shikimate kinase n=1 Tax=Litorimonas sp. RW-G-Af-16 TaxID=3241168 RepID=UPI00390C8A11
MPLLEITSRPIALVGLMGVGKTTIGRRLAKRLDRPFYDSDEEIEAASGRTVAGYFRDHGEDLFRAGEKRVIERLLDGSSVVIGTGGGAFIHPETREILKDKALTIWLKGDFETVMERVSRKNTRPLLQVADPRAKMRELMDVRYPIYAEADLHVNVASGPHLRTVNRVIRALKKHENKLAKKAKANGKQNG